MRKKPGPKTEPGLEGLKLRSYMVDDLTVRMLRAMNPRNLSKALRHAVREAYQRSQMTK